MFGWGRRRRGGGAAAGAEAPAAGGEPAQAEVTTLGGVGSVLDGIEEARGRALVAGAAAIRDKAGPRLAELGRLAEHLAGDDLDADEFDRRLKSTVERGKAQVSGIIGEEARAEIPGVGTAEEAEELGARLNRTLKRSGDVLGRHSRIIHHFARRHVGGIKSALAGLKEDRDALQALIDEHARTRAASAAIRADAAAAAGMVEEARKKSARIAELESSLRSLEGEGALLEARAEKARASGEYAELRRARAGAERLAGEEEAAGREYRDWFTRISRPLGRYEHVSALDKESMALLRAMIDDPYGAVAAGNPGAAVGILEATKKGVLAGAVSVKDPAKAAQLLSEAAKKAAEIAGRKEEMARRRAEVEGRISRIDTGEVDAAESELGRNAAERRDAAERIARLRGEVAEAAGRIPRMAAGMEKALGEISPVRYSVRIENS